MYRDVGEGSDDLLFGGEVGALLELKVADCAGEGEVAIDAAKVDEATGGCDSCLFACAPKIQ